MNRIADLNPELAARLRVSHPLGSANSVEGRLFAVRFSQEFLADPLASIVLPRTCRNAILDRRPQSASKAKPNKWLIARAQTLPAQRATTFNIRGSLSLMQVAHCRAHERTDLLQQLLGPCQDAVTAMLQTQNPVDAASRNEIGKLLQRATVDGLAACRDGLEAAFTAIRTKPTSMEQAIIDTNVFIDAVHHPQGACAMFLRYASADYDLTTIPEVEKELRGSGLPPGVRMVPSVEPTDAMREQASIVASIRGKPVSETDLRAFATAHQAGNAAVITLDSDLWSLRDAFYRAGGERVFIVRPA